MFLLSRTVDGKPMLLNLNRVDGLVMEGAQVIAVCEGSQFVLDHSFFAILKKLGTAQIINTGDDKAESTGPTH